MIDLKKICQATEEAAREAASFIINESKGFDIRKTEAKGLNNFVSYVDKGSEKMLVDRLSQLLPEAGFLTEEGTSVKKGKKYCWVIDPLDGTTNFLHGFHPYAISIALTENDEPVVGVVLEASGDESFTAWRDGGAWLNGKRIAVSSAKKLSDGLVATGFPYTDFDRIDAYMQCLTYLCKHSHGIRRLGSAAIDLAYVACGRFEVFYEYGLHPWDVAAGVLIVREAGGRASDFSGNERKLTGEEFLAASGNIYPEMLQVIKKYMKG